MTFVSDTSIHSRDEKTIRQELFHSRINKYGVGIFIACATCHE